MSQANATLAQQFQSAIDKPWQAGMNGTNFLLVRLVVRLGKDFVDMYQSCSPLATGTQNISITSDTRFTHIIDIFPQKM